MDDEEKKKLRDKFYLKFQCSVGPEMAEPAVRNAGGCDLVKAVRRFNEDHKEGFAHYQKLLGYKTPLELLLQFQDKLHIWVDKNCTRVRPIPDSTNYHIYELLRKAKPKNNGNSNGYVAHRRASSQQSFHTSAPPALWRQRQNRPPFQQSSQSPFSASSANCTFKAPVKYLFTRTPNSRPPPPPFLSSWNGSHVAPKETAGVHHRSYPTPIRKEEASLQQKQYPQVTPIRKEEASLQQKQYLLVTQILKEGSLQQKPYLQMTPIRKEASLQQKQAASRIVLESSNVVVGRQLTVIVPNNSGSVTPAPVVVPNALQAASRIVPESSNAVVGNQLTELVPNSRSATPAPVVVPNALDSDANGATPNNDSTPKMDGSVSRHSGRFSKEVAAMSAWRQQNAKGRRSAAADSVPSTVVVKKETGCESPFNLQDVLDALEAPLVDYDSDFTSI